MIENNVQAVYKIIVIGDYGIGKTCLSQRFTTGVFKSLYRMTVGLQISGKVITSDGRSVKIVVWDTAGQERFASIRPKYYMGANGAIIGFDLKKPASYQNIPYWIREASLACPSIPIIIVGMKSDLASPNELAAYPMRIKRDYKLPFIFVSSKEGQNIEETFNMMVALIEK